jgi:hypothetical protein
VPDIPLSVRRIERFSVVTGPTGIMGIVAIFFPQIYGKVEYIDSAKVSAKQPGRAACLIFASGWDAEVGLPDASL